MSPRPPVGSGAHPPYHAARAITPFSLVLLDIDHFKQINDTFGHERGDDVLAAFGSLARAEIRASDVAGRTGGEEFVLMLPDTDRDGAAQLADKVRQALHRLRVNGVDRPITASFGVATYPDDAHSAEALQRIADRALYSAKNLGRDRVVTAAAPAETDLAGDASPVAGLASGSGFPDDENS